jgi:hypothetical protein
MSAVNEAWEGLAVKRQPAFARMRRSAAQRNIFLLDFLRTRHFFLRMGSLWRASTFFKEYSTMRKTLFLLALIFLPALAQAQVTDGSDISGLDESRRRTKEIRDARQTIDDYPLDNWRAAAYLVVDLKPTESDRATLSIAAKDRQKLLGVEDSEPQSDTTWLALEPQRVKLKVSYYRSEQKVPCAVPRKLRGKNLLLGVFQVYENQVECFVREAGTPA